MDGKDGHCLDEAEERLQRKQGEKGPLLTPRLKLRGDYSLSNRGSRGHRKVSGMKIQ